ncbi:MAG: coproporphyrinogen III oxidase family protein [Thermoleophilia bacterium]|nr:coproporphyrinogen III oxidase family protein [Thermoleophilia bacterium]
MKHLYVHIPFCRSRCAYCDFASEPVGRHARAGRVERYLEALRAELAAWEGREAEEAEASGAAAGPKAGGARPAGAGRFETIYLGGGTPTVLPADGLLALVRDLAARMCGGAAAGATAPPPEFTIEANPGTIDSPLLRRLREAGVTRLSLGVQSFAPALRAALGRRVTQQEVVDALAAIKAAGWEGWNLDLVFGIPGQTWSLAAADIDAAVAAGPTHISLYDLTYTPAYAARAGAGARATAADFAERHYADVIARLEAAGYRRYEVSNFALPGHECRHNLAYWRGEDYLGLGTSAVSTVSADAAAAPPAARVAPTAGAPPRLAAERRTNPRSVAAYLAGEAPEIEVLTSRTRLWERAMLGLRTTEGVDEAAVLPVLDQAARDRLLAQGCLERRCGKLRLNPGFLDVSNTVIGALLAPPDE